MTFPTRALGKNGPQVSELGFGLMVSIHCTVPPVNETLTVRRA